jgi:hypothetical protein
MPKIELTRDEARQGDLPLVCMVCGEAGREYRTKVLSYSPWWIYLSIPLGPLPFLLLAVFLDRRFSIRAPLCGLHRYHWFWRSAVIYTWLIGSVIVWGTGVLLIPMATGSRVNETAGLDPKLVVLLTLLTGYVALLVWPFLALFLKYSGVYPAKVSEKSILLGRVSIEFIEALRVHRQGKHPAPERTGTVEV